jgi:tRNA(adenine34) deaminase
MCAGAMLHARIERLVWGVDDPRAGACGSIFNIVQHPSLNHRIFCDRGVASRECGELLNRFFAARRP